MTFSIVDKNGAHKNKALSKSSVSLLALLVSFSTPKWKICLTRYVEKVCLILNASLNFVYYCLSGRELRGRLCRALLCFLCCFCLAWIKGGRRLGYHDHFNDDLVNDKYLRDQPGFFGHIPCLTERGGLGELLAGIFFAYSPKRGFCLDPVPKYLIFHC